jgi:toxin ParE1/3/4
MTLRRVVLPEAEEEIEERVLRYEDLEEGLGLEFLAVVEHAMSRVARAPLSCQPWPDDPRYRRVVLRRFPFVLFYEVRPDAIEFVACAHARREPGYWRSRRGGSAGG